MPVYLVEHPPATQQFRCPRRERPSGVIGVHTAESFPDEDPPDTGAENVARFISRRSSYGSYHWIVDSDSRVQLIEHGCVAYHIGTHGLNEHTIGISAATQAARWGSLDPGWVDATVRNMARAAADAARWLKREHGITVPARRITLSQALNRQPGFLAHADADPDRRTDPGAGFPWRRFLDYYAAQMGDTLSWDEDLTPGTPGNDITNLADTTLPDNYGRYAADLLGYAAAGGSILLRPGELVDRIFRTDGVLRSPSAYPGRDDNPHWYAETFLRRIWDMLHALRGVPDRLDAIEAAVHGSNADEIKELINRRHDEAAAQRQAQADAAERRDAAILDLLAEHNAGNLDAAAVVDGIRGLLHEATAPQGDSLDGG